MTKAELTEAIKEAMRSKDKLKLSILRQIKEMILLIDKTGERESTDADVNSAIQKLIKMTNETLEASEKAGTNAQRTEDLRYQVGVLESLMPSILDGEELKSLILDLKDELKIESIKDMGRLMKALGDKTLNLFNKAKAAELIKEELSK